MQKRYILLAAAVASLLGTNAEAQLRLPQFFTDSMVLQRHATVAIPGHARPGSTVTVTPSWGGAVKAKAGRDGSFRALLPTPGAGGPHTVTLSDGKQKRTLREVMTGDVWLCSGQSNMEMPVAGWGRVRDFHREVAGANRPDVRLLQVKKQMAFAPQEDAEVNMGGWRRANPESVANFSAIGYFFGRELQDSLQVPIGIIDCSWGGTPLEAWTPYPTLEAAGEFGSELETLRASGFDSTELTRQYEKELKAWEAVALPAPDYVRDTAGEGWKRMPLPGRWEDTVEPGLDGLVWLRKSVSLTAEQAAKPALLKLSKIDDDDVTFVNGQQAGATQGYNLPREYRLPAGMLREGENEICVRVVDSGNGGGLWGQAEDLCLVTGDERHSLAGDWDYRVASDWRDNPRPTTPMHSHFPTLLYNAMAHPLTALPLKGVLWYQGCSNVGRAEQYARLFPAMISQWRADWEQAELPFYFVQLASYLKPQELQPDSEWALLREAQTAALELPATGMAVAIDLGEANDIHPKNKQAVAARLAAIALHNDYGYAGMESEGPRLLAARFDGRRCELEFDRPVTLHGGGQGFISRGPDGKWSLAYGRQSGECTVEVTCDEGDGIEELRYDWADNAQGNLRTPGGLPAAPFRVTRASE